MRIIQECVIRKMEANDIEILNVLQEIEDFIKKTKKNILKTTNKPTFDQVYELRNQGLTLQQIGNQLGVSDSYVFQMLRKQT